MSDPNDEIGYNAYKLDPGVWQNVDEVKRAIGALLIAGVYAIIDHLGIPRYFGNSSSVRSRIRKHRADLRLRKHQNPRLQARALQHGVESLTYSLVVVEPRRWRRRMIEDHCIHVYKTLEPQHGDNRRSNSQWGDEAGARNTLVKLNKGNGGLQLPADFDLTAAPPPDLVRQIAQWKAAGFTGAQLRRSISAWFRHR